jgi:hypothetical protein
MPSPEQLPAMGSSHEEEEILNPRHIYVAYIYDQPEFYEQDIVTFIEQARVLDYPLRYWWLSDAMPIGGYEDIPDRLILGLNTRAHDEEAGFDLYQALEAEDIYWDEHEAASYREYALLGKRLSEVADIQTPSGESLFDQLPIPLLQLDHEELQDVAYEMLGRQLKSHEVTAVSETLKQHLQAQIDWESTLRDSLVTTHELGLLDEVTHKRK